MILSRRDVEEYVRYAERLAGDLEVCLSDLRFRKDGGKLHLVVDFSEIHAFLVPGRLPDDWLWPGIDEDMKAVVEHSALSQVLTGPPKPILLAPYLLEFQNFLSSQAAALAAEQDRAIRDGARAFDELDALMQTTEAQEMTDLASRIDRDGHQPSTNELQAAVRFFESQASTLVHIVRGQVLYPLERAKAFLQTSPFSSLDAVARVQLTGKEPEVAERFRRLKRLRGPERDGATFMDAIALECVRRANKQLLSGNQNARVLLVSRSPTLARLVADETRDGLWPEVTYGVLRHPRAFAPLTWHESAASDTVSQQLEATLASLRLCSRSARLRLTGNWELLERGRGDRELGEQILELKKHIYSLTQMGGGINESRVVLRKNVPTEHEVMRLLAMLRNRDEVLNAVADRMREINAQIDRAHELIGMLFHVEEAVGREIAVHHPARGVRTVIPRMGRLPYGLRFKTKGILKLLDELQQKKTITEDDVRDLAVRATRGIADHYETLLFMAYVLALLGKYDLANSYCNRALLSADQHGREDQREARFLRVLCTRVLANDPKQYEHALSVLDAISSPGKPDARHLAEQGNIRVRWVEHAAEDSQWRPAPSLSEATEWLEKAAAACGPDRRLLASVKNSLCYAWTYAYEHTPTPEIKKSANDALSSLTETLYSLEPNSEHWPLRIKDTIVRGTLAVGGSSYDSAMIRLIIEGIKEDLESDTFAGDREELRSHLREYEAELRRRAQ